MYIKMWVLYKDRETYFHLQGDDWVKFEDFSQNKEFYSLKEIIFPQGFP